MSRFTHVNCDQSVQMRWIKPPIKNHRLSEFSVCLWRGGTSDLGSVRQCFAVWIHSEPTAPENKLSFQSFFYSPKFFTWHKVNRGSKDKSESDDDIFLKWFRENRKVLLLLFLSCSKKCWNVVNVSPAWLSCQRYFCKFGTLKCSLWELLDPAKCELKHQLENVGKKRRRSLEVVQWPNYALHLPKALKDGL